MNAKNEIVKILHGLSGAHNTYKVFYDWVSISAFALQNSCVIEKDEIYTKREEMYRNAIGKYCEKEQRRFAIAFGLLIEAFEEREWDYLGEIYMELECSSKKTGQFFTPFHISVLTSKLGIMNENKNEKMYLTEPSCGSGGIIIATAVNLKEQGIDYQSVLDVTARDLDWLSVYMCYVQLSIMGINAIVIQGDVLSDLHKNDIYKERVFKTPKRMGLVV